MKRFLSLISLIAFIIAVIFIMQASANLNDGLIAYYPFNGNATDESGNGMNGTVFGATETEDTNIFVCFVKSSNILKIYKNGQLISNNEKGNDVGFSVLKTIGMWNEQSSNPLLREPLNGNLDEIRIYNRVLSKNEIQQLHNGPINIKIQENATEGDGVLEDQGIVSLLSPANMDLVINLSSNDTSLVAVPEMVTIYAGQNTATFNVSIMDNCIDSGSQTITITASASGYISGSDTIQVADNDVSIEMKLPSGWSMISLPVVPCNASVSSLFSKTKTVYGYKKGVGYVRVKENEKLEVGDGYWVLLDQNQIHTLTGKPIHSYYKTVYENEWKLIGGCALAAKASANNCTIGSIYVYVQGIGYQRVHESEKLKPCKGYWILLRDVTDQANLYVKSAAQALTPIAGEVGIHNVQIIYYSRGFDTSLIPFDLATEDFLLPYLTHTHDVGGTQTPRDYMMDGFIFYDVHTAFFVQPGSPQYQDYIDDTFVRARMIATSTEDRGSNLGTGSARVEADGSAAFTGITQRLIPVSAGATYDLNAWAKLSHSPPSYPLIVGLEFFDAAGEKLWPVSVSGWVASSAYECSYKYLGATTGWSQFLNTSFQAPTGAAAVNVHMALWGFAGTANGQVLFDDVEIIKQGTSTNLFTDPSFASGRQTSVWERGEMNKTSGNRFLFADRKSLFDGLADAEQDAVAALGYSPATISVFAIIPSPDASVLNNPGSGAYNDYLDLIRADIDAVESAYNTWKAANSGSAIELAGMYFTAESLGDGAITWTSGFLEDVSDIVRLEKGYLFAGSPYNNSYRGDIFRDSYYPSGAVNEFDLAWVQPNAFHYLPASSLGGGNENALGGVDKEMIKWLYANSSKGKQVGVNIETRAYDPAFGHTNAAVIDYVDYGRKYGFVNRPHCYYEDAGAYWVHAHSSDPHVRRHYDEVYNFVRDSLEGYVTNGGFELPGLTADTQFAYDDSVAYGWTSSAGTYAIVDSGTYHASGLASEFSTAPATTNRYSEEILLYGSEQYTVSLAAREATNDGLPWSALLGVSFLDANGNAITTGSVAPLVWSSYLGEWYVYIGTQTSFSDFSFTFTPPSGAVEMILHFRPWGNATIEWKHLRVFRSGAAEPAQLKLKGTTLVQVNPHELPSRVLRLEKNEMASMEERTPVLGGATYRAKLTVREELPASCSANNEALLGLELFDDAGNEIVYSAGDPATHVTGLTWSSFLGMFYVYFGANSWRAERTRSFTVPTGARSAKLHLRNWYCNQAVLFDDLSLEVTARPSTPVARVSWTFDWQSAGQSTDSWSEAYPLRTRASTLPIQYREAISVYSGDTLTLTLMVRESKDDGEPYSGLVGVQFFDENWKTMTDDDVGSGEPAGLVWSSYLDQWYVYLNVANEGERIIDPRDGYRWYSNEWRTREHTFGVPANATHMRLTLRSWSTDSTNEIMFQRPQIQLAP